MFNHIVQCVEHTKPPHHLAGFVKIRVSPSFEGHPNSAQVAIHPLLPPECGGGGSESESPREPADDKAPAQVVGTVFMGVGDVRAKNGDNASTGKIYLTEDTRVYNSSLLPTLHPPIRVPAVQKKFECRNNITLLHDTTSN